VPSTLYMLMATSLVIGSLALTHRVDWLGGWPIGPSVLLAGSLIPALLQGRGTAELGLRIGRLRRTVRWTCVAAVVLGALGLGGVSVLGHIGMELPLRLCGPPEKWGLWALYQYLYVAVPEELFFRGYLMTGIMGRVRLVTDKGVWRSPSASAAVLASAAVFALSHALVLGDPAGWVTFVPGLVFAWLFARTGSLAGPILLHGTANVGYRVMGLYLV